MSKIKKISSSIAVISLLFLYLQPLLDVNALGISGASLQATQMTASEYDYDATRILVKYKHDTVPSNVANQNSGANSYIPVDMRIYAVPVEENLTNGANTEGKGELNLADSNSERTAVRNKLEDLLQDPTVEAAVPNYYNTTDTWTIDGLNSRAYPDDYDPPTNHWYYEMGNLPEMWYSEGCGAGDECDDFAAVTIAVIDTGLAFETYDDSGANGFTGKVFDAASEEYVGGNFNLFTNTDESSGLLGYDDDCNGIIDDIHGIDTVAFYEYSLVPTCTGGATPIDYSGASHLAKRKMGHPVDTWGHGSLVTGNIAGNVDNLAAASETLVSPMFKATIMPIAANVHFTNGFYDLDIYNGVIYAVIYGADVINLSLGGAPYSTLMNDVFNFAAENNVFVVASSGNDNGAVEYPAAYQNVFAVGAADQDSERATYSNYGTNLDMVAYVGDGTIDTVPDPDVHYSVYQETLACFPSCSSSSDFTVDLEPKYAIGTSFAAPQVSAAAGIIFSNYQEDGINIHDVRMGLIGAATDIGTAGFDTETGYGVLDYSALSSFIDSDLAHYYFTWYDTSQADRLSWILVGNPSESETAVVNIRIGSEINRMYNIPPGGRITPRYNGILGGPVIVTSNNTVYSSQRSDYKGSFNEYAAISELFTSYYFAWYDTSASNRLTWTLVGNPSAVTPAEVTIKIGNTTYGANNQVYTGSNPYVIPPGGNITPRISGILNGPVYVTSLNGELIYASQRTDYEGSFNEYAGIPSDELSTEYYFSWYDTSEPDRLAWTLVGNPATNVSNAEVTIKIGNTTYGANNQVYNGSNPYVIAPGGRITPRISGILTGPVIVTSTNAVNVFSTQRVSYKGSFNEYAGIKGDSLQGQYYFTWYDTSAANRLSWILVGNPSSSNTVNVNITIGSSINQNYSIPPGGKITPRYSGILDGPVIVTEDTGDAIYTTQRTDYEGSFNEYPGIPN